MLGATRITVHPGEDVLLPAGVPFDGLRGPLADLLRRPELRHVPMLADGVDLSGSTVVGERPLLPGVTVRAATPVRRAAAPGATLRDPAARLSDVVAAPWVVARTTGAQAGELWPLRPGAPIDLPGGLRARVTRRGTVRVGGRIRRWRPGVLVHAGGGYLLARSGSAEELLAGIAPAVAPGSAAAARTSPATMVGTALLPALGAVTLAVILRQPTFALFAVVGLLGAVPQVVTAIRRRRADADPAGGVAAGRGAGPGAAGRRARGGDTAGRVRRSARGARAEAAAPPGGLPAPDVLARAATAALAASDTTWREVLRERSAAPLRDGPSRAPHRPARAALPDGALAVRGPGPDALAAARAVVAGLVAEGRAVHASGPHASAWAWCRWIDGDPTVVVTHPTGPDDPLDTASAAHRAGDDVVLVLPPGAAVPPWCRAVLDVAGARSTPPSPSTVVAHHGQAGGGVVSGPFVGVTEAWAERFARQVAAVRALGRDIGAVCTRAGAGRPEDARDTPPDGAGAADPADARLPAVVSLATLLATADDGAGVGVWEIPLGVGVDGRTVTFDLVADGPHLLVAGTTGAGKSELLQALVLALALRHTPTELTLALIDFKGGASFGPCAGLPHVVGQVSDLDVGLAARALDGLRAELARRKALLAEHGVADVAALPSGAVPRLVVVVDEFRALADDLPELLPGLLRVAAQGRSLGVHLVLATQRPAGAVSADVRANVSARLALRVVDAADSHDVLDSPAAARIPAGVPGRAVLRVGAGEPVALQCAYAGAPAASSAPAAVYRAPTWPDRAASRPSASATSGAGPDVVAGLVERARTAAAASPAPPWPAPWLPPLPATVDLADVGEATLRGPHGTGPAALPLALGDAPTVPARVPVAWDPAHGHLAILGRARSGRSTALRTLAHAALERGWHVHALVPPASGAALAPLAGHPGLGTLAGTGDPRRAVRLLRLLRRRPPGAPPALVLIDDVDELRAALATPTGDPVAAALADGTAAFAVTSASAGVGGLASRFGPRLVLTSSDATADAMLGAPSRFAGRGGAPGRGVWLGGAEPLECQVALAQGRPEPGAAGDHPPARVLPLPRTVDLAALRRTAPHAIGIGGDQAVPLGLAAPSGALVVGPRGAGRTTTLRLLLGALAAPGTHRNGSATPPVVMARDRALLAEAARRGARAEPPTGVALRTLLAQLSPHAPHDREGSLLAPVVVIDDADVLAQSAPLETEQLAELAADGAVTVLAAAGTLTAAMAQRGLLAQLRATRTGLVLSPFDRGAQDVFGVPLDDAVDPGAPGPGRAVLVEDGAVTAIQLAAPGEEARRPGEPVSARWSP